MILGNYKRFDTKKHNLRTIKRNRILYILDEEFLAGYDGKLRCPKNVRTYVYKNMMSWIRKTQQTHSCLLMYGRKAYSIDNDMKPRGNSNYKIQKPFIPVLYF